MKIWITTRLFRFGTTFELVTPARFEKSQTVKTRSVGVARGWSRNIKGVK